MGKELTKNKKYSNLIKDLRAIIAECKKEVIDAAKKATLKMYWRIGERITKEGITQGSTLKEIASLIEIEETLLDRIVKFYRIWSVNCSWEQLEQLSWSHHKVLIALEDSRMRKFYLDEAVKHNWDWKQLAQKIKDNYSTAIETQKGAKAQKNTLERKTEKMYLYSAIVEKVVDGDTILLRVDLGFDVSISQRVRLRGIDCPEISTPQGQKAKKFVEDQLKGCKTVVIQTFKKIDMYGRYVCDLFYFKGETDKEIIAEKGNFLNQELLDNGLAVLL